MDSTAEDFVAFLHLVTALIVYLLSILFYLIRQHQMRAAVRQGHGSEKVSLWVAIII